ncbi:MAG: PIN domain-containing protein [Gammaproteobacteria bacterium]|nr:PIN domain-containing protein [Gammaproteobacteria bacterium]
MESTCVVDANFILRWLLGDHEEHSPKATAFWREVQSGQRSAFVSEAIFAECVFVLQRVYRTPRGEIAQLLHEMLLIRHVVCDSREAVVGALKLFEASNISFADALVIAYAQSRDMTVMSFDRNLLKAAKRG